MATGRTVRQVKQGEKLRRSQNSLNPLSGPNSDIEQNEGVGVAKVVKTSTFGNVYNKGFFGGRITQFFNQILNNDG